MKPTYIYLAGLLLLAGTAFCQTKAKQIEAIRSAFISINSDTSYQEIMIENEALTEQVPDGGISLTGYISKDTVRKLVLWTGLSYGIDIQEYYFRNNQLIFAYEQFRIFKRHPQTGEQDLSQTRPVFESRHYFHNNQLLASKTSGQKPLAGKQFFSASRIPEEAGRLLALIKQKKEAAK